MASDEGADAISGFRLSPGQLRYWRQAAEGNTGFSRARVVLDASITPQWLGSAVAGIASRNDMLRAVLREFPGMSAPLQVILPEPRVETTHLSLAGLESSAAEEQVRSAWENTPVPDWHSGPLVWLTLFDLPGGRQMIQIVTPAIIADPESLTRVLGTVCRLVQGGDAAPDDSELSFLHYSEWAHDNADSEEALDGREHWRRLNEAIEPVKLPFERNERSYVHGEIRRRCAPVSEIEALCAWAAVLGRYAGTRDLTIHRRFGSPPFAELAAAIGPFAETLPLPLSWSKDEDWSRFLERTDAAIEHAEGARPSFDPLGSPVAPGGLGFVWHGRIAGPDLESSADCEDPALILHAHEREDHIQLELRYDAGLHDPAQIERLADTLLQSLLALPHQGSTDAVVRLGPTESALLEEWGSQRSTASVPGGTFHAAFDQVAQHQPDAAAIRSLAGEISFRDLAGYSDAIAASLTSHGIVGSRVALMAARTPETIAAMLGILKAGGAFVPIDPLDPPARIDHLIRAADVAAIMGDVPRGVDTRGLPVLPIELRKSGESPSVPPQSGESAAYIIFTSGTTGTPKGVVVPHSAVLNLAGALQSRIYGTRRNMTVSVNAPFSFDASIKQITQLLNGHCLALVPHDVRRDSAALFRLMDELSMDVFDCTPSHLKVLINGGFGERRSPYPSVLLVGGEPIDEELWRTLANHPVEAWNVYGPTETTVNASVARIENGVAPNIGRPLDNVTVRIVDEDARPAPIGAAGEIWIGGSGVASGYIGAPEETSRRFLSDPFSREATARCYRSGDLGRFDADGNLQILGRIDDQMKINGYRVEPAEIAAAISRHPTVADAHVGLVDDERGGKLLTAWYAAVDRTSSLRDELFQGLQQINHSETDYLFNEIFIDGVYSAHDIRIPPGAVVFDVGANIGIFSIYVQRQCPDATIFAFEPIAPIHEALERNVARFAPGTRTYDIGLSSGAGAERFAFYPGYSTMSGLAQYANPSGEIELVKQYLQNQVRADSTSTTSRDLLDNVDEILSGRFDIVEVDCNLCRMSEIIVREDVSRIDLLKIDVQRAELDVLHGIDDAHWPIIQQVVMEVHDTEEGPCAGRLSYLTDLLESRGFAVRVEQGDLLHHTDRYNLYAQRPDYVAGLGTNGTLTKHVGSITSNDLRDHLSRLLPDYMIPSAFVEVEAMPLLSSGKIDSRALPSPLLRQSDAVLEPPANDGERLLAEVWKEVLGLLEVGVDQNFFQLGGDSIRSIQVHALARKRGFEFELSAIFKHQTIRAIVAENAAKPSPRPEAGRFALLTQEDRKLVAPGIEDAYPLSALQAGMVWHVLVSGRASAYHNATAHEVCCPLDGEALDLALADTIRSHPILRTGFDLESFSEPLQLVHKQVAAPVTTLDLSTLDESSQRAEIRAALEVETTRPFDLAQPPLLRVGAYRLSDERFALTVAEFHGILDGWSLHLLVNELCWRYHHRRLGRQAPIGRAGNSLSRFVELENEARGSAEAREFWRGMLGGYRHALLPNGNAAGAAHETRRHDIALRPGLGKSLGEGARAAGVPLKSLLMAVHLWAIARASGTRDVVTGMVVGGRPDEPGGDVALGLFINTVPFRLELSEEDSWADLARRAFAAEVATADFGRMPLGAIQRLAGSEGPLFNSIFNFTQFHALTDRNYEGTPARAFYDQVPVDIDFPMTVDFELDAGGQDLDVYIQYDAAIFERDQIALWASLLEEAIGACSANPLASTLPLPSSPDEEFRSPLERQIALVWAEVLAVQGVGRSQMFAELGGDSLIALRLRGRLARELRISVPLAAFTCDATVTSIAQCAEPRAG